MTHRELRVLGPSARLALSSTVELPYSEVCVHMRVAGQVRPVVPVEGGMAQILDCNGELFSFPITRGEAGVLHV